MQNVTPISIDSKQSKQEREEPSYSFLGGVSGFVFYWLAFALPFLVYGSNTLFFLLYTWPFFLALMPLSVLIGITLSMLLRGRLILTLLLTGAIVLCLFWLVFSFLTGWLESGRRCRRPKDCKAVPKVTKLCSETPVCADWPDG